MIFAPPSSFHLSRQKTHTNTRGRRESHITAELDLIEVKQRKGKTEIEEIKVTTTRVK